MTQWAVIGNPDRVGFGGLPNTLRFKLRVFYVDDVDGFEFMDEAVEVNADSDGTVASIRNAIRNGVQAIGLSRYGFVVADNRVLFPDFSKGG